MLLATGEQDQENKEVNKPMRTIHIEGNPFEFYAFAAVAALLFNAGCSRPSSDNPTVTKPIATKPAKTVETPKSKFPKPEYVRGIYLTAWGAGSTRKMDNILAMLKRTEINSLVIDIRDSGQNYWKNDNATSAKVGANKTAVVNPAKVMDRLEKAGVYPIARISCFRDNFVPAAMPNRAVVHSETNKVWKDRSGNTWLDPYNQRNWEYIGEIVDFALDLGFPEIQLDYVRFPSEGKSSTMAFPGKKSYENPKATPTEVVAAFAHSIRERVHAKGAILSADIFGIVSSGAGDQGIGQALEDIAEPFDLICPMVYPSHFAKGEYGIKDPNASPYAIVLKSLQDYKKRLPDKSVRPWLQDFSLGVKYGKKEVQSQIKAARESGYEEYLLWNPQNRYTEAAVVLKK